MASPLPSAAKRSVDLSSEVRVSRIRREPPPAEKPRQLDLSDRDERNTRIVVVGVTSLALALIALLIGLTDLAGWTLRDYMGF